MKTIGLGVCLFFLLITKIHSQWVSAALQLPFTAVKNSASDTGIVQSKIDLLKTKQLTVNAQDSLLYTALYLSSRSGLYTYGVRLFNFWSQLKISQDEITDAHLLISRAYFLSQLRKEIQQSVDFRDMLMQKVQVHFYRGEFDSSYAYAVKGAGISRGAKDLFNESLFLTQQAVSLAALKKETSLSDSLFKIAQRLAKQTPSLQDDALSLHNYAYYLKIFPVQNLKKSLETLLAIQEFSTAEELRTNKAVPWQRAPFYFRGTHLLLLHELASGYLYLGDFEQATAYMRQCTRFHRSIFGDAFLARLLAEQAYFESYHQPAARVKELFDSAVFYAKKYYNKPEIPSPFFYYVKAWLNENGGNMENAVENYQKAIALSGTGINENHIALFRACVKNGDLQQADSLYLAISKEIGQNLIPYSRIYFYKELPAWHRLKKNEQMALQASVEYYRLKDSLAGIANYLVTGRLEKQFKTKEKDRLLAIAENEKKLKDDQIAFHRKQNFFLVGGLLLLLLAAVVLIRSYVLKKKHAALLEQKNKQIETLIRELHHRVKNNLQVVSGLLSLQANRLEDEAARQAMDEGRTRVDAMAMIHQKLYMDKDMAALDIKDYLETLANSLAGSFGFDKKNVETKVALQTPGLDIDVAIPVGLIVNELVTNAFKHAFAGFTADPKIEIMLTDMASDKIELRIADNGKGITGMTNRPGSLGMKLVHTLVAQLNGSIEQQQQNGTVYKIQLQV